MPGIPRILDQLFRERQSYQHAQTVLITPQQPEADFSRLHRVPEYWQIFYHQHAPQEESLHHCSYPGRDESLAVHHTHEAHLPHRLSRYCATDHGRHT